MGLSPYTSMHSILRQSSNIARISRSSLQTAARASLRSTNHAPLSASIRAVQQARLYSNKQKPEKDNEVKNDGKTPLSKKPEAGESSEPELAEGMVRMNPEDEKAMRELLDTLKMGLPKSQVEVIERAFENIQKESMPKELRELMDDVRGKPMTLSSAAKLTRLASQMARKQAERDMDKDSKKTDFQSNDPKGSSGGFGGFGNMPPGGNKGGKQQQEGGFKVGEIKIDVGTLLLSAFVSYLLYRMVMPGESRRDITYQEFRSTFLDKGLVEKLTVTSGGKVRVDLHREATQQMFPDSPAVNPNFHYYFSIGSVESFERRLDEAQNELGIPTSERIPVNYASEGDAWGLILSFGPTLLFIGAIFYMSRRASGGGGGASGVFGMGKSRAKQFNHETDVKVKFADVA